MWEELHIASGMRLPIVMANANRALSAPINIHCDHGDAMGARDAGWVMLFAETAQEAYDNTIIALKVAEDPDVLLPAMTCLDGFITTHSIDRIDLLDDETVTELRRRVRAVRRAARHGQPGQLTAASPASAVRTSSSRRRSARRSIAPSGVIERVGAELLGDLRSSVRPDRDGHDGRRRGRDRRHRLLGGQRASRGQGAACRGRQGGRRQGALLPSVPGRGARRGAQGRQGGRGPGPLRVVRCRGRSAVPRDPQRALRLSRRASRSSTTSTAWAAAMCASSSCARCTTTCPTSRPVTTSPAGLVYLGAR